MLDPDAVGGGIGFLEADVDALVACGREVATHVVRADGEFAVAAVHENGELNAVGSAEGSDGVHGGADAAAGVEDVVGEDDGTAGKIGGEAGGYNRSPARAAMEIVAVHGNIHGTGFDGAAGELGDGGTEAAGDRCATGGDADQGDTGEVRMSFNDLVGNAAEGARDGGLVEDELGIGGRWRRLIWHGFPLRPRWTALKVGENLRGPRMFALFLHAFHSPSGAVADHPIGEGALETDIVPRFLAFDPFMAEHFFSFGQEFAVKNRIPHELAGFGGSLIHL